MAECKGCIHTSVCDREVGYGWAECPYYRTADVVPRAEVERLQHILDGYALQYGTATDKEVFLKKERDDTVRKMAERLKDRYEFNCNADEDNALYYVDLCEWVERIAKEILDGGETNDTV